VTSKDSLHVDDVTGKGTLCGVGDAAQLVFGISVQKIFTEFEQDFHETAGPVA
jgi:hypothetical protein